jgi:outer membrane protein OmpA-like peptidoglycan-associated protein
MSLLTKQLQPGALLLVLLACGAGAAARGEPPPPDIQVPAQPGRPLASRTHEPRALLTLQGRLDSVSDGTASECLAAYTMNKAQAWLNFDKYAAAEQLPATAQAAGLKNADALIDSLERHEVAVSATPELPGARHVRDDLWQAIAAVKSDGRLCAAPKMTAYCEVELAWMDYEAGAGGRRHVDPYVRIAEDYCSSAIQAQPLAAASPAARRELPASAAEPSAPAPPLIQTPSPAATPAEELGASVVFPHNRATRADIRPPGRLALRQLAQRLRSLPPGATLVVVGHADLTGEPDYNLRLSEQRARSVVRELQLLGVRRVRIELDAVGSSEPVMQCPANEQPADRRRYLTCLEPNRRVVVHLLLRGP